MSRQLLAALSLGLCLVSTATLAADPSLHEVYQAAEAGNYRAAQGMMDQVLHDHPNSGKAHFVEAELLAKEGQVHGARTELATAERLEPGLPFAKPEAVAELKARLTPNTGVPARYEAVAPQGNGSGLPWGMILMGIGLVLALLYFVRSRAQAPVIVPASSGNGWTGGSNWGPGPQPYGAGGVGPLAGPMAPTGGAGSGILGSLATGAAVGAGVVAGEALMHRVLDGGHREDVIQPVQTPAQSGFWDANSPSPDQNYDMGSQDFGVNDAGSWDDGGSSGSDDWT